MTTDQKSKKAEGDMESFFFLPFLLIFAYQLNFSTKNWALLVNKKKHSYETVSVFRKMFATM